jgi:uncharacterized membrane protein YqjE
VFKESIAKFLKLDSLFENVAGYVETRIEILKYDLKEELSTVLSKLSVLFIILLIGLFALMFFSFALAFQLGEYIGMFGGFLVICLLYTATGIAVYSNRKKLEAKFEKEIRITIKQKKK